MHGIIDLIHAVCCSFRMRLQSTMNVTFCFVCVENDSPVKKVKRKNVTVPVPKNAVCMLNELRPGLVYETVSQTGPVHCPVFTIGVKVSFKLILTCYTHIIQMLILNFKSVVKFCCIFCRQVTFLIDISVKEFFSNF